MIFQRSLCFFLCGGTFFLSRLFSLLNFYFYFTVLKLHFLFFYFVDSFLLNKIISLIFDNFSSLYFQYSPRPSVQHILFPFLLLFISISFLSDRQFSFHFLRKQELFMVLLSLLVSISLLNFFECYFRFIFPSFHYYSLLPFSNSLFHHSLLHS